MSRAALVAMLGDTMTAIAPGHPPRIGIDGWSAAGKTNLADDLAAAIRSRGRPCPRAEIDDFHRPGHKYRSQQGGWTPRSYYEEGYDYDAFRALVLDPLGRGGSRRCRVALFDSYHDSWYPETWHEVSDDTIAVVDGIFLFHPTLADCWEYMIWLDIDPDTMIARARERDTAWASSADAVEDRYRRHWIPTHMRYQAITNAPVRADTVIDNRDFTRPRLIRPNR